ARQQRELRHDPHAPGAAVSGPRHLHRSRQSRFRRARPCLWPPRRAGDAHRRIRPGLRAGARGRWRHRRTRLPGRGDHAPDHPHRPARRLGLMADYERILITGAAGSLGAQLREGLADLAPRLRLADRADMGVAAANEELVVCALADRQAAFACIDGCDALVHFAGTPREHPFAELLRDGLPAAYNIWEGARRHGVKRIVHASSIHAVGFCEVEEVPDTRVPHRPDTFYGLGKCFVEDLAALYWDKWGLETVC